jgi:hypothetical protein
VTASILGFGYQRKCRRYRSVFSARATGRSTWKSTLVNLANRTISFSVWRVNVARAYVSVSPKAMVTF